MLTFETISRRGAASMILFVLAAFLQALPANFPGLTMPAAEAQSTLAKASSDIPEVTARLVSNCKQITAGQPFKLGVQLIMPPGWHTYYKVSGDAGMPTSIDWHLPPGFKAGEIEWQKPSKFTDSGITTYGYQNKTLLAATITPPDNLPVGGKMDFSASVRWLQCKDLCVPGKADLSLTLAVAGKALADPAYSEDFALVGFTGEIGAEGNAVKPAAVSILSEKLNVKGSSERPLNLMSYLLLAFIGGFILNFMPCVLPVISIKVLGFVQQAGEDPKRVFQLGLTFTAGILSSFLFLAGVVLLLQQTGQEVGWGFQFQHPAFVIVMAVIVLLFALSLFGLFYIAPPPGQSAIDKVASKEGAGGTFFKGVLATTLSTPCTAPFLGTAVGFAFTEPWWVIVLIFLVVGLGMAFPYLLLTARPGWMKFIPRPGAWMEKFKQSLGFLLLATVVWLLRVLGAQVGFEQALWVLAFLVIIAFAVWVVSSFTDLASTERRVWTMRAIALILVGTGYYFCIATVPGLGLPAPERNRASAIESAGGEINWLPFTVSALDRQLESGKTVFLDFTAEWCLTCKVNEQAVIDTKPVVDKLKTLKVVTMKADWTRQDPQISNLLHKFGRSGVPLYVIFPAGNPQSPIVLPEVITAQIVLDGLDKAGPSKD